MSPIFDSNDPRPIHFVGIGGAGMSALALVALRRGIAVTGCDLNSSTFGDLAEAGATVSIGHDGDHVHGTKSIIVTAAMPPEHPELATARQLGIPVIQRKDALAELVNGLTVIAIAGTHGKTTTTVMTTEALLGGGISASGLAGGRVASWGGNARLEGDSIWVVEADEFDQAFLTLRPTIAVINNVELDHLECYGSADALDDAFVTFGDRAETVLIGTSDPGCDRIAGRVSGSQIRFGIEAHADLRLESLSVAPSGSSARCTWPDGVSVDLRLRTPGAHNLRNASAALGVVRQLGGDLEGAVEALANFDGVGRRFERLGTANGIEFVDDYAHHPTELIATLSAARQTFPGRRLVALFQPHLFSRTQQHGEAMGEALSAADVAIVAGIFPAREEAIPGVTSEIVVSAARRAGLSTVYHVPVRADLTDNSSELLREGDVFLTLGAGDVTAVGREIHASMAGE